MENIGIILAVISIVCVAFEGGITALIFGALGLANVVAKVFFPESIPVRGWTSMFVLISFFGGVTAFLRSPAQRRDSLAQLMQRFPFLKERAEQHCGTLSGGEQQLVAILRALMGAPRLLLLDEPTLGLAPLVVKNIGAIIRELHREGLSILIAEQNAAFACSLAEQIVVLENGHVALAGTPVELQARDDMRRSYLGV